MISVQRRKEYLSSPTRHLSSKIHNTCKVYLTLLAPQIIAYDYNLEKDSPSLGSSLSNKDQPLAIG